MRSKEEAHDYRYFPDPDLPLLVLAPEWLQRMRQSLTELPEARRSRFVNVYAMSDYDAGVLTMTRALAEFFDETARLSGQPKAAANWIMGDLMRFLKDSHIDPKDISASPVSPKMLADMITLVEKGTISGKIAKTVMEEMYKTGKSASAIIEEKGLVQISNTGELEGVVDAVVSRHADAVAQYRSGKQGSLSFLVGQVMKATQGRANPQAVNELLRKRLAG
jgi:aspartyl-tRNA(Asn)/glutamyl-tRNA(Gln) amidotransferase subunit B